MEKLLNVARAKAAIETQQNVSNNLIHSYLRHSLSIEPATLVELKYCLVQISKGIGSIWDKYQVIGVTRDGAAPAKEPVGKNPRRYKLVDEGTIFPM